MRVVLLIGFALVAPLAHAGVKEIDVKVKGLVCAFCANGLKATFLRDAAVDSLLISLEKKQLRVFVKDGKDLSDDDIRCLIEEAGFQAGRIDRLAR